LWRHFDYILFIDTILLTAYGVVMIYSANLGSLDPDLQELWRRQAILGAAGLGLILLLAVFPRNYQWLGDFWWLAYLLAVVLLVLVLIFGQSEIGDVRGWFDLGFFNLQPSFLAMNLLTVSVGAILSRRPKRSSPKAPLFGAPKTSLVGTESARADWLSYFYSAAMTFILAGLVFAQPDMGTAAVLVSMWFAMLLQSDVKLGYLVLTILIGLVALVPLWNLIQALEFDYMLKRVLGFINPRGNINISYQLEQATIAIGSGGLLGKGLAQGTQSQLRYLPVRHTDFIFAVIAEELGFVGVILLFVLYLILFLRLLRIILIASDTFGRLVATGALAMILFQATINIGMNLGLLPVVGLPLPFISYGPAALLTMMLAIGMAENVAMRHRKLEF
jgi:rod shape determining protein RodA